MTVAVQRTPYDLDTALPAGDTDNWKNDIFSDFALWRTIQKFHFFPKRISMKNWKKFLREKMKRGQIVATNENDSNEIRYTYIRGVRIVDTSGIRASE